MASPKNRARVIAAVAVLGLGTTGMAAIAWASDTDDDGPDIESVTGDLNQVVVTFDEPIQTSATVGDFAFEHFGQKSVNPAGPHIHRPTTISFSADRTQVTLGGMFRPLHEEVSLPLVAAYVRDDANNVSRPEESFTPGE